MANRENTAMKAVKLTAGQPDLPPPASNTGSLELFERNHAVLPRGLGSDELVGTCFRTFCTHVGA